MNSSEQVDVTNTPERRILDLSQIGMRSALSLGRFHYTRVAPGIRKQCHANWLVLQYALRGSHSYYVDGKSLEIRGGQGLRILPGEEYSSRFQKEQRGDLVWLILQVKPLPAGADLGMTETGVKDVFARLLDGKLPAEFLFGEDLKASIEEVFEAWERRKDPLMQELIRNRIASVVLASALCMEKSEGEEMESQNSRRVGEVMRWLEKNIEKELTVEEMAKVAGLSVPHFFREFKRFTGTSPNDFLLQKKVDRAAVRLAEKPPPTVTQIAHELGFSSSQYFSTVFRRYRGMSPTEWRSARSPSSPS
ncbi:AraC family transcriptional regulator [Roseibacillus persicicus]|uniref:AraC family transcriptional regulator n=1 Tax=Roseibacillus persicicus TaxID=454148 RepID=UPI00398ADAF8